MAVDTDEVYITTKLAGKSTFSLQFNKGHNLGTGNPPSLLDRQLRETIREFSEVKNLIENYLFSNNPINAIVVIKIKIVYKKLCPY